METKIVSSTERKSSWTSTVDKLSIVENARASLQERSKGWGQIAPPFLIDFF
jgi:hypothetical protein